MAKHVNKHAFFDVFRSRYDVKFLSDYHEEHFVKDTPGYLLGCIDTIVCARARVFVGTYKSTFTGYIHRLRGYMRDVDSKDVLFTQHVYPTDRVYTSRHSEWHHLGGDHPFWGQEYVEAWEGAAVSF
jgi:hypothetical protein